MSTDGPLAGTVVLDLTRLQPGNYATLLMADLGAKVIKIEEPGKGDYVRWSPPMMGEMSAAHRVLNRNKLSVTLNLKHARGVSILLDLVRSADVVIESFRPGVLDRLGAGYGQMSQVNPGIVYAAITGYGQTGPYRNRAGHDINYVAQSGVLATSGVKDGPPVLPSVQIADLAGAMMAVIGVLAALRHRAETGEGDLVDVSMMDASLSWMALHLAPWFAGDEPLERGSGYLNGGYPFYRVYRCADGKYVSVGALEPKFWRTLCQALDLEDLIDEQFAAEPRRSEIHRRFEDVFLSENQEVWVSRLAELEACVAPVNEIAEMAADPQVRARGMISEHPLKGFPSWKEFGVPLQLRKHYPPREPAPGLGEHNAAVFSELGLDAGEIARLSDEGVI